MARLICLLSALALAVGCQPIKLDPDPDGGILPGPDASRPSTLTIHGQVCTAPVDPSQFPVKIVFLIDSSGSMCISDGPGSQASSGLCETIGAQLVAQGITVPGRVRSLRAVIDSLKSRPEVSVALVPFDSKVNNAYPDSFAPSGFVPASDGALGARIDSLQNQLGKGTDYQGALAEARARIENDVLATIARGQRSILPRARYVVVMLTDGTPYPRCAADDNNPDPNYYATVDRPSGVWRDDPASFCNLVGEGGGQQQDNPECLGTDCSKPVEQNDGGTPECLGTDCNDAGLQPRPDAGIQVSTVVPGYVYGTDRNQNYQLFGAVDAISALSATYNVGEIRFESVLLFNKDAVNLCGQMCATDLYNGLSADDAEKVAVWTLTQMAQHGGGTFREFSSGAAIDLSGLNLASLASAMNAKTLIVRNLNSYPGVTGPLVDSAGDGIPDTQEDTLLVSSQSTDTDGDGIPNFYEASHSAQGFDPLVVSPGGCRDTPTVLATKSCVDTDGDGLSEAMEALIGTDPTLVDTDADGIPDGLEIQLGLDPLKRNDGLVDTDADGVPDLQEILAGTNPTVADSPQVALGYSTQMTAHTQSDGRTCYDFTVSGIRLVDAKPAIGAEGTNYLTVTFDQAPQLVLGKDYGVWTQACLFARQVPEGSPGPEVTLQDTDFRMLDTVPMKPGQVVPTDYKTACRGEVP